MLDILGKRVLSPDTDTPRQGKRQHATQPEPDAPGAIESPDTESPRPRKRQHVESRVVHGDQLACDASGGSQEGHVETGRLYADERHVDDRHADDRKSGTGSPLPKQPGFREATENSQTMPNATREQQAEQAAHEASQTAAFNRMGSPEKMNFYQGLLNLDRWAKGEVDLTGNTTLLPDAPVRSGQPSAGRAETPQGGQGAKEDYIRKLFPVFRGPLSQDTLAGFTELAERGLLPGLPADGSSRPSGNPVTIVDTFQADTNHFAIKKDHVDAEESPRTFKTSTDPAKQAASDIRNPELIGSGGESSKQTSSPSCASPLLAQSELNKQLAEELELIEQAISDLELEAQQQSGVSIECVDLTEAMAKRWYTDAEIKYERLRREFRNMEYQRDRLLSDAKSVQRKLEEAEKQRDELQRLVNDHATQGSVLLLQERIKDRKKALEERKAALASARPSLEMSWEKEDSMYYDAPKWGYTREEIDRESMRREMLVEIYDQYDPVKNVSKDGLDEIGRERKREYEEEYPLQPWSPNDCEHWLRECRPK